MKKSPRPSSYQGKKLEEKQPWLFPEDPQYDLKKKLQNSRVEQRFALHELARLGLGRQEDIRLIQNVVLQSGFGEDVVSNLRKQPGTLASLLPEVITSSSIRLVKEASIREEWRREQEDQILSKFQGSNNDWAQAHVLSMAEEVHQDSLQLPSASTPGSRYYKSGHNSELSGSTNVESVSGNVRDNDFKFETEISLQKQILEMRAQQKRQILESKDAYRLLRSNRKRQVNHSLPHLDNAMRASQLKDVLGKSCIASKNNEGYHPLKWSRDENADRRNSNLSASSSSSPPSLGAAATPPFRNSGVLSMDPEALVISTRDHGLPRKRTPLLPRPSSSLPGQMKAIPENDVTHSPKGHHIMNSRNAYDDGRGKKNNMGGRSQKKEWSSATDEIHNKTRHKDVADSSNLLDPRPATAPMGSGSQSTDQDPSRFKQLWTIQSNLVGNVSQHQEAGGWRDMVRALQSSTAEAQEVFSACLAEALQILDHLCHPDPLQLDPNLPVGSVSSNGIGGPSQRDPTISSIAATHVNSERWRLQLLKKWKQRNWALQLRLGQLGLTARDVGRLQYIRQSLAARVIQRRVRPFLERVRTARAAAETRRREHVAKEQLRARAAVEIQKWVRGHWGRLRVKELQEERALEGRRRRRREAAAQVIQYWWRRHIRVLRSRWRGSREEEKGREGGKGRERKVGKGGKIEQGKSSDNDNDDDDEGERCEEETNPSSLSPPPSSSSSSLTPLSSSSPSASIQMLKRDLGSKWVEQFATDTNVRQLVVATVRIQAHVRGWLVRRSDDSSLRSMGLRRNREPPNCQGNTTSIWWARQLVILRQRRTAVNLWRQQRVIAAATAPLHSRLVAQCAATSASASAIVASHRKEEQKMELAWSQWMDAQQRTALSQALPRGWVPYPDPKTQKMAFLNAKNGQLHALHPAMASLMAHAAEERKKSEEALQQRRDNVTTFLSHLYRTTAVQYAVTMRALLSVIAEVQKLTPTGGDGKAGGGQRNVGKESEGKGSEGKSKKGNDD